jgi:uncharacterized lipoprotein YddW (UPF0748 family)
LFSPTWVLLAAFGWAFAVGAASGAAYEAAKVSPPAPSREFRGVWVASVGNIDWPSRKGMTSAEQQTELLTILDRAQRLKLNAVVLQVRPSCDALYVSRLEPWSEFLSGNMGQAPEPFYDPLLFAVTEAHKRGLELHAWFNPYRARVISDRPASATHISKTHPELVRAYGKYLWLDPGEKAVQDYSFNVVMDVVKRYDVDGIHFDDYFYPYREKNAAGVEMSFPDDASWKRYGVRTKMSRDDWRRDNVNKFVEHVYRGIKAEKPWVKFGISPFGIWRPTVPKGIAGLDTYAELYADTRKWLVNGWVDYFAPQIYWAISSKEQSFPLLLNWWAGQNPKRRQVFVGMDATKVRPGSTANDPKRWPPQEIVNQIRLARNEQGIEGHILWNMKSLARNEQFEQTLARDVYQQPALIPPAPWLSRSRPAKPSASAEASSGGVKVAWSPTGRDTVAHWVVQARTPSGWSVEILPASATSHLLKGSPPQAIAVTAVDRNGNASDPAGLAIVR